MMERKTPSEAAAEHRGLQIASGTLRQGRGMGTSTSRTSGAGNSGCNGSDPSPAHCMLRVHTGQGMASLVPMSLGQEEPHPALTQSTGPRPRH